MYSDLHDKSKRTVLRLTERDIDNIACRFGLVTGKHVRKMLCKNLFAFQEVFVLSERHLRSRRSCRRNARRVFYGTNKQGAYRKYFGMRQQRISHIWQVDAPIVG